MTIVNLARSEQRMNIQLQVESVKKNYFVAWKDKKI